MAFKVAWDNGASACGVFDTEYDTEEAAQNFADDWMSEMNAIDGIGPDEEGYFAEVIDLSG